jgi:hypothetical protein
MQTDESEVVTNGFQKGVHDDHVGSDSGHGAGNAHHDEV